MNDKTRNDTSARIALVTGGGRRIGAAISKGLADRGWSIAIHCNRRRDDADACAEAIMREGGTAKVFQADLTDSGAVDALIPSVAAEFGAPALLVNNASIFEPDDIHALDRDLWRKHMAVHLEASCFLTQHLAAALNDDADGLVVNIIDQRVWKLTPQFFSYTLSKAALWTATQTMAQALAPRIRVNAIGPGPTLSNTRQDPGDFKKQTDAVLLRRGPDLSEFADTISYFWDAPSVTGQMIAIDGGQHLAWETPDVVGLSE